MSAAQFAAKEADFRRPDPKERPLNISVQISVRTVSVGGLLRKSLFLLVGRLATELSS